MTKDTRVNFENDSNDPIRIKAARSSVGRFDSFTLNPGESRYLQDSNGGSGNYDIEWDVIINPGQPGREKIAAFRADNPTINPCYLQPLSASVWSARETLKNDPIIVNGVTYETEYFPPNARIDLDKGQSRVVGKADKGEIRTFKYTVQEGREIVERRVYLGEERLGAFDPSLPFARVEYLGDSSGKKTWNFTIDNF